MLQQDDDHLVDEAAPAWPESGLLIWIAGGCAWFCEDLLEATILTWQPINGMGITQLRSYLGRGGNGLGEPSLHVPRHGEEDLLHILVCFRALHTDTLTSLAA